MSAHGYGKYTIGCRCDVCRKAKADYMRERRAAARKLAQVHTRPSMGAHANASNAFAPGATRYVAPIERHGTRSGYEEHGCRCRDCTATRTASDAKYRSGS